MAIVPGTSDGELMRELRSSEERFRLLFESAGDSIFLMDGDVFVACNQKTLEIFGCPRASIIGAHPYDLSPAVQPNGRDSKKETLGKIKAALDGTVQRFEWQFSRCDKTPFDAEVTLSRLDLGGRAHLQAIVRDITDRKRLEEERERLAAIIEHTPDYISIATPAGVSLYLNESFKRILPTRYRGTSAHEIPLSAFYPTGTYKTLTETAIPHAIRHGVWQGQAELLDSTGKAFPISQTIIAHLSPSGRAAYLSTIARDISALKQQEEEMEQRVRSERDLFKLAQRVGHIGIWQSDPNDYGKLIWSPETYSIFGFTPETFDGRVETFFKAVHPEDLEKIRTASRDAMDPKVRAPYSVEHRVIRPDGQTRWVHQEGQVIWGVAGAPVQFIGTVQDTTELHEAKTSQVRAEELERINRMLISRETKMIELKKEIERLKQAIGGTQQAS